MTAKIQLILPALLMLIQHACFSQSDLRAKDAEIQKMIRSNPQLGKKMIYQFLDDNKILHDSVKAKLYMYNGYAFYQLNNPDSAIYYYNKTLQHSDSSPKIKAQAYLNLGIQYRKLAKYDIALKNFSISQSIYTQIANTTGVAMVDGEIASVHNQKGEYEKSIILLLRSLKTFETTGKANLINPIKQRLASTYLATKNYAFTENLYIDVLSYFKTSQKTKNYLVTLVNYGQCLYYQKKYAKARAALNEAVAGLKTLNDQESIGMAYSWLGAIEFKEGRTAKAEKLYDKSLQLLFQKKSYSSPTIVLHYLTNLNNHAKYEKAANIIKYSKKYVESIDANSVTRAEIEKQKAITYKNNDQKDKSIAALEEALKIQNAATDNKNQETLNRLQAKYQNKLQLQKNITLTEHNKVLKFKVENETQQKIIVTGLFIISVGIMIVGYWFILVKKKQREDEIQRIKINNELAMQKFELEQESNRRLKKTIIEKQADLVSGAMTLAVIQENITEMLNAIKYNRDSVDVNFLTGKLQTLVRQEDYWKVFEDKFDEIHPHFKTHLSNSFPNLNSTDLFFASLLKLKLPFKEVGKLMAISPDSVVKRKYRLKKKLNVETEEEFYQVLSNV